MQLLIFFVVYDSRRLLIKSRLYPFGLVGSNGLFGIWFLRNQVLHPFAPIPLWEFGGLKWTRTIDLTLIRRVL